MENTTKTANKLIHKIQTKTAYNVNYNEWSYIVISLKLADECKNGHHDFSITADGYTSKLENGFYKYTFCGCCHDEILKAKPDFQLFVDLHLSDFEGSPMYSISNGFYHAKDESKPIMEKVKNVMSCMRCDISQAENLVNCEDILHFQYLVECVYKLPALWKIQANQAISTLETMTGLKWVKPENCVSHYKPLTIAQIADIENKLESLS